MVSLILYVIKGAQTPAPNIAIKPRPIAIFASSTAYRPFTISPEAFWQQGKNCTELWETVQNSVGVLPAIPLNGEVITLRWPQARCVDVLLRVRHQVLDVNKL